MMLWFVIFIRKVLGWRFVNLLLVNGEGFGDSDGGGRELAAYSEGCLLTSYFASG